MSAPLLLIDGYNVMHAMGPVHEAPGELQRGRQRLLEFLSERLTHAERSRAIVVFDARDPPPGRPTQLVIARIQVLFALPEGDADLVLDRLLSRQASRHVTLVSSDRWIQQAARARRAKALSSRAFLETLHRRPAASPKTARRDPKEHGLSATEIGEWMAAFGDIETADLATPETPVAPPSGAAHLPPRPSGTGERAAAPRRPRQPPSSERHPPSPSNELRYWLSVFGHLDRAGLEDLDR